MTTRRCARSLRIISSNEKFEVFCFPVATDALEALAPGGKLAQDQADGDIDLIISDIKMPQMDGLEFTSRLQTLRPEIPIILITAFGSIETAIEAMRRGAFHYVVKPFKLTEMAVQVDRALEHRKLQRDNTALRQEVKKSWALGNVIGKSAGMKAVFELVQRVSQATANVLITGESGTGKEMVARAIHQSGPRANKPFIAINCTAIPETLLESELFGHAKGSFTGAIQRKRGLFEEAEGGTLFLDEIGDMNVALQSKLLRVIQERKVRAVGDNVTKDVDVRIIAATHKDLKLAIKEGRFRDDLYYRLSVIPIVIPPLRHRPEDIPLLAEHFLKKVRGDEQRQGERLHQAGDRETDGLEMGRQRPRTRELRRDAPSFFVRELLIDADDTPTPETENAEVFLRQRDGGFADRESARAALHPAHSGEDGRPQRQGRADSRDEPPNPLSERTRVRTDSAGLAGRRSADDRGRFGRRRVSQRSAPVSDIFSSRRDKVSRDRSPRMR